MLHNINRMMTTSVTAPPENPKNITRLSSLLGTWTGQLRLKLDVIEGYFVMYLTGSPLVDNQCTLGPSCSELKNQICLRPGQGHVTDSNNTCNDVQNIISDWSDLNAYMYFGGGYKIPPVQTEVQSKSTGDWVGPYSIIMARNESAIGESISSSLRVIDQYTMRYVKTPMTPFLRMSRACDLFSENDFPSFLGEKAVNSTIQIQASTADPFQPFYKTCSNGDVKPILPLVTFTFVENNKGQEMMRVEVNYEMPIAILPNSSLLKAIKLLQKTSDVPLRGPYCYENDPQKAYLLDLSYDSIRGDKSITLDHACVDGLPCTPRFVELCASKPDIKMVKGQQPGIWLSFPVLISMCAVAMLLVIGFIVSCRRNRRLRQTLTDLKLHEEVNVTNESLTTPLMS